MPPSLRVRSGNQAFFLQPLRVEEAPENPVSRKGELHHAAGVVSSSDPFHLASLEERVVALRVEIWLLAVESSMRMKKLHRKPGVTSPAGK